MKYLILISLFALGFWCVYFEPRFLEVNSFDAPIEKLSPDWSGKKIAFLADFQVGMWLGNESTITQAVQELIAQKPHILLIGGDFIYHPTDDDLEDYQEDWGADDREHTRGLISKVVEILRPLRKTQIKVYAVLGNHDYSMGHSSARMIEESASMLKSSLGTIGVEVLANERRKIQLDSGAAINLIGLAPHYPKLTDVDKAIQGLDEDPTIFFMHNSSSIKGLAPSKYSLALAGHTHGGQIRLPWLPNWSWTSLVPRSPDEVWGDGWVSEFEGRKVYINRGIGFSNLPVRLNCRPELTFFTLIAADSGLSR